MEGNGTREMVREEREWRSGLEEGEQVRGEGVGETGKKAKGMRRKRDWGG